MHLATVKNKETTLHQSMPGDIQSHACMSTCAQAMPWVKNHLCQNYCQLCNCIGQVPTTCTLFPLHLCKFTVPSTLILCAIVFLAQNLQNIHLLSCLGFLILQSFYIAQVAPNNSKILLVHNWAYVWFDAHAQFSSRYKLLKKAYTFSLWKYILLLTWVLFNRSRSTNATYCLWLAVNSPRKDDSSEKEKGILLHMSRLQV